MKLTEEQEKFLQDDLLWRREHRIQHAEYQLVMANTKKEKSFWNYVIQLNKV